MTGLAGDSEIGKNQIIAGGLRLNLISNSLYIRELLGRTVELYYTIDDGDIPVNAVYAQTLDDNDVVVLKLKDIEQFNGEEFTYQSENGRTASVSVSRGAFVIHNGTAVSGFDNSLLEYDFGTLTIIPGNNYEENDIIKTEFYKSWVVNSVDKKNFKIYDSLTGDSITADISNKDVALSITDSGGNPKTFDDIRAGMILDVSASGAFISIILNNQVINEAEIVEIYSNGKNSVLTFSVGGYGLTKSYYNKFGVDSFVLGSSYTIYLNSEQSIAWTSIQAGLEKSTAYLIDVKIEQSDFRPIQMKLFDSTGNIVIFDAAKKVNFTDEFGVEKVLTRDGIQRDLFGYNGVIRFKYNSDREISHIEKPILPEYAASNDEGRFYQLKSLAQADGYFISNGDSRQFGNSLHIDTATVIFCINEDRTDDSERYSIKKMTEFRGDASYAIDAYSLTHESPYAEFLLIKDNTGAKWGSNKSDSLFVVTQMVDGIDTEHNVVKKVKGYEMQKEQADITEIELVSLYKNGKSAFDDVQDAVESTYTDSGGNVKPQTYTLQKGDVIRYSMLGSYVDEVRLIFDSDGINPSSPAGRIGTLAGTIGYFDPQAGGKTNPWAIDTEGSVASYATTANTLWRGSMRFICGYVYSKVNINGFNYLTYTTQDLSAGGDYDPSGDGGRYCIEVIKSPPNIALIEHSKNGDVSVAKGNTQDILSYKDAGADCSQIVVYTGSGRIKWVLLISREAE